MRLRIKCVKINKIFFTFFLFRKNYVLVVFLTATAVSPYAESERREEGGRAESEERL